MSVRYYKRYRMEIDLLRQSIPRPVIGADYSWHPWCPSLLSRHAAVKFESFRGEIDAVVFDSLADRLGCERLMHSIASQAGFLPRACWLASWNGNSRELPADCGTIQGVLQKPGRGAVQNLGVVAEHRGAGLGRALMLNALHGFRQSHIRWVTLEVTAGNLPAIQLYESIGFRRIKTMYRAVKLPLVPALS